MLGTSTHRQRPAVRRVSPRAPFVCPLCSIGELVRDQLNPVGVVLPELPDTVCCLSSEPLRSVTTGAGRRARTRCPRRHPAPGFRPLWSFWHLCARTGCQRQTGRGRRGERRLQRQVAGTGAARAQLQLHPHVRACTRAKWWAGGEHRRARAGPERRGRGRRLRVRGGSTVWTAMWMQTTRISRRADSVNNERTDDG